MTTYIQPGELLRIKWDAYVIDEHNKVIGAIRAGEIVMCLCSIQYHSRPYGDKVMCCLTRNTVGYIDTQCLDRDVRLW